MKIWHISIFQKKSHRHQSRKIVTFLYIYRWKIIHLPLENDSFMPGKMTHLPWKNDSFMPGKMTHLSNSFISDQCIKMS